MLTNTRAHLREAGESYFEHLRFAALVGAMLVAAGVACLLHALLPALCRRSASGIVGLVVEVMADRSRLRAAANAASGPLTLTGLLLLCTAGAALLVAGGLQPTTLALAFLLAGFPVAYLATNPDLDPVD